MPFVTLYFQRFTGVKKHLYCGIDMNVFSDAGIN